MSTATWEFEAADPEVGFLTDSITHTCEENLTDDVEDAVVADVTRVKVTRYNGKEEIAETITYLCPKCNATTAATEHWPLWFFEEPRDEHEGR